LQRACVSKPFVGVTCWQEASSSSSSGRTPVGTVCVEGVCCVDWSRVGACRVVVFVVVCSFVPWTGSGSSIADINETEAISGDRGGMPFVLDGFVVSSSFVSLFVVWQVASSSSSSKRNVVRSHGGQHAAVLVIFSGHDKTNEGRWRSNRQNVTGQVASSRLSSSHAWVAQGAKTKP